MMDQPIPMRTLSQILEKLKTKGYDNELVMNEHQKMTNEKTQKQYEPSDLEIIKTYRFEGMSDPADNTVLYLITDKQGSIGYILDAYGADSNNYGETFDNFLRDIPTGEEMEDF